MAARLLRQRYPNVRLTESHPKALLWLIRAANEERRVPDVRMEHLTDFIECEVRDYSEHERDAALGAVAAAAMISQPSGWIDLAPDEPGSFAPVHPVAGDRLGARMSSASPLSADARQAAWPVLRGRTASAPAAGAG